MEFITSPCDSMELSRLKHLGDDIDLHEISE